MKCTILLRYFIVAGLILLVGCNAADNMHSTDQASTLLEPKVAIAFPPPVSYSEGRELLVRGYTNENHTSITELKINGVIASTEDNFLSWQVRVPLERGENLLEANITTTRGQSFSHVFPAKVTATEKSWLSQSLHLHMDSTREQLLVIDSASLSVFAYDLGDKSEKLISSIDSPKQRELSEIKDTAFDELGGIIYLLGENNEIIKIVLDSGERSMLSTKINSNRVSLAGIAWDGYSKSLVLAYLAYERLLYIDVASGEIKSSEMTNGKLFNLIAMKFDNTSGELYFTTAHLTPKLYVFKPAKDKIELLYENSDNLSGNSEFPTYFDSNIIIDHVNLGLVLTRLVDEKVMELTVPTSEARIIKDFPFVGIDPGHQLDFQSRREMVYDSINNRFIFSIGADIYSVESNKTITPYFERFATHQLEGYRWNPRLIAHDPDFNGLYIVNDRNSRLIQISEDNKRKSYHLSAHKPRDLNYDPVNQRIVVSTRYKNIQNYLNTATGLINTNSGISDEGHFRVYSSMAIDEENKLGIANFVPHRNTIKTFNLLDHEVQTMEIRPNDSNGVFVGGIYGLAVDSINRRILVSGVFNDGSYGFGAIKDQQWHFIRSADPLGLKNFMGASVMHVDSARRLVHQLDFLNQGINIRSLDNLEKLKAIAAFSPEFNANRLAEVQDMTIDFANQVAYVVDQSYLQVVAVDLVSGEKVVIAN